MIVAQRDRRMQFQRWLIIITPRLLHYAKLDRKAECDHGDLAILKRAAQISSPLSRYGSFRVDRVNSGSTRACPRDNQIWQDSTILRVNPRTLTVPYVPVFRFRSGTRGTAGRRHTGRIHTPDVESSGTLLRGKNGRYGKLRHIIVIIAL